MLFVVVYILLPILILANVFINLLSKLFMLLYRLFADRLLKICYISIESMRVPENIGLLSLVKNIEKLILTFFALFTIIILISFLSFLGFTVGYPIDILSLVEIFTAFLSFLLSIYHMKFANQFMCLASEECYKKQDTTENTTSQPSTNQSPPQSPPKHTQEHHTQN